MGPRTHCVLVLVVCPSIRSRTRHTISGQKGDQTNRIWDHSWHIGSGPVQMQTREDVLDDGITRELPVYLDLQCAPRLWISCAVHIWMDQCSAFVGSSHIYCYQRKSAAGINKWNHIHVSEKEEQRRSGPGLEKKKERKGRVNRGGGGGEATMIRSLARLSWWDSTTFLNHLSGVSFYRW